MLDALVRFGETHLGREKPPDVLITIIENRLNGASKIDTQRCTTSF
jgi:hypothetical protein